uniref:Properdin n=1 Tax=Knipowitschia caucasica TaxID=637954 RepID=A0AAV2M1J6_KNICA
MTLHPPSDGVRCFSHFDPSSLSCEGDIGDVDTDSCCFNPKYGYRTEDGKCHACGPPTWSSWTLWSQCTTLCGEGVRLRGRRCYGIGQSECEKTGTTQQAEWCNGTCCNGEGWSPWSEWSPCSVSCGEGAVKSRVRTCSDRPECALACTGAAEETQACPVTTCPVHGGWSVWSPWSKCSSSCFPVGGAVPTRTRHRSCSSPAPSLGPPGNGCRGDSEEKQQCTEMQHCAVDGGWGPWSAPGPCSVSCGEGIRLSVRVCDQPPPQYGGRFCEGPSTQSSQCSGPCPVVSSWTGWSQWSDCSEPCVPDGGEAPHRTRHRTCFTLGDSEPCQGPQQESGPCPDLSFCQVHGSWGPWSAFGPCMVSCGVGLQVSTRSCDSPTPKHGGRSCEGDDRRSQVCDTKQPCPVDGVWSEWSSWGPCQDVFDASYSLRCEPTGGSQSRERRCLHRALGGAPCPLDENLSETRVCYDVTGCYVKGHWNGWGEWSQCLPPCGDRSRRSRKQRCDPDYTDYSPTIGPKQQPATFVGEPLVDCRDPPAREKQDCVNAPPCPA